ncbi:hypothetical protein ES707_20182 [subsurface metagenome]
MEKILDEDDQIVPRPSEIEPFIKVMMESKTMNMINDVANQLSAVIKIYKSL